MASRCEYTRLFERRGCPALGIEPAEPTRYTMRTIHRETIDREPNCTSTPRRAAWRTDYAPEYSTGHHRWWARHAPNNAPRSPPRQSHVMMRAPTITDSKQVSVTRSDSAICGAVTRSMGDAWRHPIPNTDHTNVERPVTLSAERVHLSSGHESNELAATAPVHGGGAGVASDTGTQTQHRRPVSCSSRGDETGLVGRERCHGDYHSDDWGCAGVCARSVRCAVGGVL